MGRKDWSLRIVLIYWSSLISLYQKFCISHVILIYTSLDNPHQRGEQLACLWEMDHALMLDISSFYDKVVTILKIGDRYHFVKSLC